MPTYELTASFQSDLRSLSASGRADFGRAVKKFVSDLSDIEQGQREKFRKSLRVKDVQGSDGVWEMTWQWPDGRATFQYGAPIETNMRHVIWRRIGGHDIFSSP